MIIKLLGIDPQYDFCDVPEKFQVKQVNIVDNSEELIAPALPVPGAWEDSIRLAKFLRKAGHLIDEISITLDTHQLFDIAHPDFWLSDTNEKPAPFTEISHDEVKNGKWRAVHPQFQDHALEYTKNLEDNGSFKLMIWPAHCLVGTAGHNVIQPIAKELQSWEQKYKSRVIYIAKGHNPLTEHYGPFKAEIPLAQDPTTTLNLNLIQNFESADLVLLTGQALSHCVGEGMQQLIDNFGEESIKKLVLLRDTTSPVAGFESIAEDMLEEMKKKGLQVVNSTDIVIRQNELVIK